MAPLLQQGYTDAASEGREILFEYEEETILTYDLKELVLVIDDCDHEEEIVKAHEQEDETIYDDDELIRCATAAASASPPDQL